MLAERLAKFHKLQPEAQALAIDELLKSIWLFAEEARKLSHYSLTPVESVYGFVAFLTTRQIPVTFGAHLPPCDALPLIDRFVKAQGWENKCRDNWDEFFKPIPTTVADIVP